MQKKQIIIALGVVAVVGIGVGLELATKPTPAPESVVQPVATAAPQEAPASGPQQTLAPQAAGISPNVRVENGEQIIDIEAKGGYSPETTVARANMPTKLNFKTDGTYDCSTVVSIPDLQYRGHLPMTGMTSVDVPAQQPGKELSGTCGMGMYGFSVRFAG